MTRINVYPVGVLAALIRMQRCHNRAVIASTTVDDRQAMRRWARASLRNELARLAGHLAHRRWHSAKNTLNGYLAEPEPFPDMMRRCGSGWTPRRAVRSLYRHGWIQPCEGPYYCPTAGDTECCPAHSGWDRCCLRPDLHQPVGT